MATAAEPLDVVMLGTLACEQGVVLKDLFPGARLSCVLDDTPIEEMTGVLAEARVVLTLRYTREMPPAPHLEFLQVAGSGWDGIDIDHLPTGVVVANAYGHEGAIAEYVVLAMLLNCSTFREAERTFRAGSWRMSGRMDGPLGRELGQSTVGIVGLGRIGQAVARRARCMGARVLACTRTPAGKEGLAESVVGFDALQDFLGECDFVVVATALGHKTLGLIGVHELVCMKDSGVLINVARGEVVDEDALFHALRTGLIGGAVLDAWYRYPTEGDRNPPPSRHPFAELENVLMTPHSSAWTKGMLERRWAFIAENLARFARGAEPENVVYRT